MIEIKNISKKFNDLIVLENIDLKIKNGEIISLIGPNGAGKSTLINIILGILGPDNGSINSSFDKRKDIGVMMQNDSFPTDLNPIELIKLHLSFYGKTLSNNRIISELENMGLESKKSTLIRDLSGGQKRRLSFLLSIIHKPKLIILDEPSNAMDLDSVELLWNKIFDLKDEGCTIIIISHDLDQIDRFAERIVVLNHSTLVFDESIKSIHSKKVIAFKLDKNVPSSIYIDNFIYKDKDKIVALVESSEKIGQQLRIESIDFMKKERNMTVRDIYRLNV